MFVVFNTAEGEKSRRSNKENVAASRNAQTEEFEAVFAFQARQEYLKN